MQDPLLDAKTRRDWQAIGAASGLGFSIVFSLLFCVLGGIFLDQWLGTMPLLTLVGVALGFISAGYLIYELAVLGNPTKGRVKLKRGAQAGNSTNGLQGRSATHVNHRGGDSRGRH